MKKTKRFLPLILAVMLVLGTCFALTGCGGGGSKTEAKLTASYASTPQVTYNNMRPQYNYFMTTFKCQTLETYDDGTYCLIETSTTISGLVLPEAGNDFAIGSANNTYVRKYFGTFSSAVDSLDEGTLNATLSKPTRFVVSGNGMNVYFDTANWTTIMGEKSGTKNADETITPSTAEEYLAKNAFSEKVVAVTIEKANFEFTSTAVSA